MTLIFTFAIISNECIAQNSKQLSEIRPSDEFSNIHVIPLYSDSLTSSFVIWIKIEVKLHKHVFHSEQIYVLEGSGEMKLGNKTFMINRGDYVFIPKNTVHSVITKSPNPLKVLSIQSPKFEGKDRVMINN